MMKDEKTERKQAPMLYRGLKRLQMLETLTINKLLGELSGSGNTMEGMDR